jgi:hypothetical protein
MFFRRERPKEITFEDRLENLKQYNFSVAPSDGRYFVSRGPVGAVIENGPNGPRVTERAGRIIGTEIGALVDGGFQKYFLTPTKRKIAATAQDLRDIHAFQEDLREGLGLVSLYNESLGTTSTRYLYDRVKDRDHGVPRRPWEQQA